MLSSPIEPRTLTPRVAYAHVAAVIGLALFASGTPSPLYGTYRELWGFSPGVLTLIYAMYAFGVLAALLLAGRVSDEIGRRPVLLTALGTLMVTSVVFMLADSTAWLFVARGIQGLATGLALGAASAALLDLHPRRDPASVGLTNGVVSAAGMGLGIGISSLLVELAPAPRVLPYVVLLVLFAVAFYGALRMPEPVAATGRVKLTPQRPRIPPAVRRPFLLAALAVISSWSIGGLFISLGPTLSATLLHTEDHIVTALGVVTLAGAGAAAQLAFGRSAPWAGTSLGSLALATGMVAIVIASSTGTLALFWFGAVIGGAGFGVAFLGGLRALSAVIPPQHRAEVMSAFYVVAYLAISLPAVLAGVLVTPLGLEATFEIFGSVVAALALAVAFEAYRTRPVTARLAVETA
ncbi:MAG TPA: MFS transporter [Solirubrobacter sp.]|nr:MFS transporter [Solirubrobacter sp.]